MSWSRCAPAMVVLCLVFVNLLLVGCGHSASMMPEPTVQQTPAASSPVGTAGPRPGPPGLHRARSLLGSPRSGGAWFSGVWPGGDTISGARADNFGAWRGTAVDAATTYPESKTWQSIHDSTWHITTYAGFAGVLSYGMPILPSDEEGTFASIVAGEHDWVYRKVAQDLVAYGRGASIVRIGWEANGEWFPWNTTVKRAAAYRAAYRHIVAIMKAEAPDMVIDFDLACGTKLRGQSDRLDALTLLYPGDDVVDLIGCDTFDWDNTMASSERSWDLSTRPADSIGIQDVADFARAHGKGLTVPEWGLASEAEGGEGDNPYYIKQMRSFFEANADLLVLESYFNEPATSIANSLWDPTQAESSAVIYQKLW
jgi:hypothetical protein